MSAIRLALGTAQFGFSYGVANQGGQIPLTAAAEILSLGHERGVNTLDTAVAYGDSEDRLGQIGVRDWQVITKLPSLPDGVSNVGAWVAAQVADSLQRLRTTRLHGLLLHRPGQLLGAQGEKLYKALQTLRAQGVVAKVGISIYAPEELDELVSRFNLELVQAPFSILDRRLHHTGWLQRLTEMGIEVHVRSVFLQGLLLMPSCERPEYFARWQSLWDHWDSWLQGSRQTPLRACLGFALANPSIDRVIVGVDSLHQLQDILSITELPIVPPPEGLCSDDLDLVNPSRWVINT